MSSTCPLKGGKPCTQDCMWIMKRYDCSYICAAVVIAFHISKYDDIVNKADNTNK